MIINQSLFGDAVGVAHEIHFNRWSTGLDDGEIHAGYKFEEGMFARLRSWVEVAPWIRLARVLRILASPLYVGLVAIALALTVTIFSGLFQKYRGPSSFWQFDSFADQAVQIRVTGGILQLVFFVLFLWLVWIPVIQTVCRGGAALTSGKSLPSAGSSLRLVVSRVWKSYLVPMIPLMCVLTFAFFVFLIRIPSLVLNVQWISMVTGWAIGIASIPIGILGFGALFAIPFGVAAMVNEPAPDPIDSLSRGYEYLFRRPLSLIWYFAVSVVLIFLSGYMFSGVGWATSLVVAAITSAARLDEVQRESAFVVIRLIVSAWQLTLAFGLLGGVYLLLRRDACGQEAEDLWEPPKGPSEPLPSLPREAKES